MTVSEILMAFGRVVTLTPGPSPAAGEGDITDGPFPVAQERRRFWKEPAMTLISRSPEWQALAAHRDAQAGTTIA